MNHRLVFTAYSRPRYFIEVLQAWENVRGYPRWRPHAFIEPSPHEHVMTFAAATFGAGVTVNPHRRGVLSNPWHALETAFTDGADFTVLAEEDVLPSTDVLELFTDAAHRFRDQHILAVCAASFAPTCPADQVQQLTAHQAFSPLIWGTWRDRWTGVLRDTWDHHYDTGTPEHPESGWDWNINLRIMKDWRVISPIASRSVHIGADGGTHTTAQSFPASVAPTFTADRAPGAFLAPTDM